MRATEPDAFAVDVRADDVDVEEVARERRSENVELDSVEAVESVLRREPHVPFAVLADILDAVVGHAAADVVAAVGVDPRSRQNDAEQQQQYRDWEFPHGKNRDLVG